MRCLCERKMNYKIKRISVLTYAAILFMLLPTFLYGLSLVHKILIEDYTPDNAKAYSAFLVVLLCPVVFFYAIRNEIKTFGDHITITDQKVSFHFRNSPCTISWNEIDKISFDTNTKTLRIYLRCTTNSESVPRCINLKPFSTNKVKHYFSKASEHANFYWDVSS